jgi:hypothetical protein
MTSKDLPEHIEAGEDPSSVEPIEKKLARSTMLLGLAAALGLSLLAVDAQAAPVVTLGCDLAPTLQGAVRYRNLSNQAGGTTEIRIGRSPLSSGSIADVTWGTGKAIEFSYNGAGILTTKVGAVMADSTGSSLGALNYLEINITKNTLLSSINLNTVLLGSDSLGSFGKASGTMGNTCWRVTGIDVGAGFTLTGTLALTGLFGGGDSSLVQIDVGFVTPADAEGPITSNVYITPDPVILNGDATVKATVDDSTTGGNSVASAEYQLNSEPWLAMEAQDGAFGEVSEDVEATFEAAEIGENWVCVRGTDSLGNVGDSTCQSFLVTYKFEGFESPVDNGVVNVAKAGQAIPLKWRLTDYYDVPIEDPASFVGLFSSVNVCAGGDPTDAVEEYSAGKSGLQYNGDGYWQYNWKTDKNYANTCRAVYVEFDSGATSPFVKFQFKK